MKISEDQKKENRAKLILAAIEVITEKGYYASTMREIAKKAGLAEATIYNYFSTKEKLIYAYYEGTQKNVIKKISKIKNLELFTLRERTQLLIDSGIEEFLNHREFVQATFSIAFLSPTGYLGGTANTKRAFTNAIAEYIETSEQKGEIPEQTGKSLFPSLAWDYYLGVLTYWLKDESENFANTTLLTDKSLAVIEATLKSGIISSGLEFANFLYRSHIAHWLEGVGGVLNRKNSGGKHEKRHK